MVLLLTGASHTGKTLLAQRLLEKYKMPYLSIDHLKMGLIRSGNTTLTPEDDGALTAYLWPIVREMVKTAVENGQSLIVEGGYIPFDWQKDFDGAYLEHIRFRCLILSEAYIRAHFEDIKGHACAIERRRDDSCFTMETALAENAENLAQCQKYGCDYVLIDKDYRVEPEL